VFFDNQVTPEHAQTELNRLTPLAKDALREFLMKAAPTALKNKNSSRAAQNSYLTLANVGLVIAAAIIVVILTWGYRLQQREGNLESRITKLVESQTELEGRNQVLVDQLKAANSAIEGYKEAGSVTCQNR
jgi:hypothetical protein